MAASSLGKAAEVNAAFFVSSPSSTSFVVSNLPRGRPKPVTPGYQLACHASTSACAYIHHKPFVCEKTAVQHQLCISYMHANLYVENTPPAHLH